MSLRGLVGRLMLLVPLSLFCVASSPPPQFAGGVFVIRDVRVFDGAGSEEHQTVVIADGKITAAGGPDIPVPAGAEEVSGSGRTLLPGLIDAHVHFSPLWPIEALQQSIAFGVTGVVDMWTGPPPRGFPGKPALVRLKEIEASDSSDLAAVRTAGTGATAPGGHPTQMEGGWAALVTPTINHPEEAGAFVAARIAEGSDFIKIIYDDTNAVYGSNLPTLGEDTIAALVTAAHAQGRLAVAHIGSERYARGAIAAGVDGIVHLFVGPSLSHDFAQFVAKRGAFVIPTLSVLYPACGRSDGPEILRDVDMRLVRSEFRATLSLLPPTTTLSCDAADQAVRQLADAGVPLLAGTDSPGPGTTYGASLHREIEHLVNAGLTPTQALAAATSVPARIFGMTDRGTVKVGMRADLLLVDGDPTKRILDTRRIVSVWKRGVRLQRLANSK